VLFIRCKIKGNGNCKSLQSIELRECRTYRCDILFVIAGWIRHSSQNALAVFHAPFTLEEVEVQLAERIGERPEELGSLRRSYPNEYGLVWSCIGSDQRLRKIWFMLAVIEAAFCFREAVIYWIYVFFDAG